MENPKTQQEMFKQAQTRIAERYTTFMEIRNGNPPLTRTELEKLIQKHPEVWGVFSGYLDQLP